MNDTPATAALVLINVDTIPPLGKLDIVVPLDVLKLGNLLRVLRLNEIKQAPRTEAQNRACSLRAQPVPDVRQDQTSSAKEAFDIDRGGCAITENK